MFKTLFLTSLIACANSLSTQGDWAETEVEGVFDFQSNPILVPDQLFEWLLGDPTVLQTGDKIHMFANTVTLCIYMNIVLNM